MCGGMHLRLERQAALGSIVKPCSCNCCGAPLLGLSHLLGSPPGSRLPFDGFCTALRLAAFRKRCTLREVSGVLG